MNFFGFGIAYLLLVGDSERFFGSCKIGNIEHNLVMLSQIEPRCSLKKVPCGKKNAEDDDEKSGSFAVPRRCETRMQRVAYN